MRKMSDIGDHRNKTTRFIHHEALRRDTTLQIFSYPILDEKGNLISVIEYMKDITEEQRLQEQLIQSEKLAGIGILASGVAHEINNPLSGIIGMAEVALEEEDISKSRSYLMDIMNCAQRIGEIVRGLKSYSRAAKKEDLSPVDLNEVLEESLKMVRLAIKTASVEVIKKFQPIEKIQANTGEIQQVFTNLITNAFQAMDGKGGKLVLSTRSLKDSVEVKVSDSGNGIPQKYLNQIFDPFFTTKKPGEGTGLGLNIVYRIVTKYEGTIDVESKEQVGTTFTIKFPIRRVEVMSKKVLIVDDEEVIRKFLRIHLVKLGYEVTEAADGEQAIEQLGKDDFDLLICDIMMPKKDGWEVIKEAKSNPKTKNIPVIVLTAKNEDSDMFKGYDLGANYYMTKPFTKAQLLYGLKLMFDETQEGVRT